MRGQLRRAHPAGCSGCGEVGGLERQRPDHQVTADHQLPPHHLPVHSDRHPLGVNRPQEQQRADPLGEHVRDRRAGQPETGRIDQQRRGQRRQRVGDDHDPHRRPGVLHAPQPAVAGQHDQDAGQSQDGDPQPLGGRVGDRARAAGDRLDHRSSHQLPDQHRQQPDPQRQPGRLDALVHRGRASTGAEVTSRSPGGAVLQRGAEHRQHRHHRAGSAQGRELDPAEVPDHGGVDQQEQRLGGQHHEGRGRQRHYPAGRDVDGAHRIAAGQRRLRAAQCRIAAQRRLTARRT